MSYIFKSDAATDDAWIEVDLGSDQSDVWLTYEIKFAADALAFWQTMGNYSGNFHVVLANDDADQLHYLSINSDGWVGYNGGLEVPVADVWATIEAHRSTLGVGDTYLDGVLFDTGPDIDSNDARFVRLGQSGALTDAASVCYFRNIKVGTTRGGTDIFADDFSDGTFDAWTTTFGDVSLIEVTSEGFARTVKFGDFLAVTDEGSNVIRVDADIDGGGA